MKAIVRERYGGPEVLELREIEQPALEPDGVLVRVHASSAQPIDWHLMRGEPRLVRLMMGVRRPKRKGLGVDVAGVVEAVGPNVHELRPGDAVFGAADGAFAEYACDTSFVAKPAELSFEQAGSIAVAGCTALQALRDKGRLQPGQSVLVNGASGGVGTFAVQVAKALGAQVTGVCSTRNVELVRSLGADDVVDYTAEDFTKGGRRYDVILDMVGNRSFSALRRATARNGTIIFAGGSNIFGHLLAVTLLARFVPQRAVMFIAKIERDDLVALGDLVEAGKLTPVIDRTYPLAEVAEALRYSEAGRARGKVVVTVGDSRPAAFNTTISTDGRSRMEHHRRA